MKIVEFPFFSSWVNLNQGETQSFHFHPLPRLFFHRWSDFDESLEHKCVSWILFGYVNRNCYASADEMSVNHIHTQSHTWDNCLKMLNKSYSIRITLINDFYRLEFFFVESNRQAFHSCFIVLFLEQLESKALAFGSLLFTTNEYSKKSVISNFKAKEIYDCDSRRESQWGLLYRDLNVLNQNNDWSN